MRADWASLLYARDWGLGRARHIPEVAELVGGHPDSHSGRGRSQAKGLAVAGMEKEGSLGFPDVLHQELGVVWE